MVPRCVSTQRRRVSTHHCLGPGLCDGCEGGRRQRSSSPAACAWRRLLAWGRCSEAAVGTRAEPSPSPPAHRLRPSWSAGSPGPGAAEGHACQINRRVAMATDGKGTRLPTQLCVGGVRLLKIHRPDFMTLKGQNLSVWNCRNRLPGLQNQILRSISPQRTIQRIPNSKPSDPFLKKKLITVL